MLLDYKIEEVGTRRKRANAELGVKIPDYDTDQHAGLGEVTLATAKQAEKWDIVELVPPAEAKRTHPRLECICNLVHMGSILRLMLIPSMPCTIKVILNS